MSKRRVTPPQPKSSERLYNILKRFLDEYGWEDTTETLRLLAQRKLLLHVWRRSTPHNWWLAPVGEDHDYSHWHSDEDNWRDRMPHEPFIKLADADTKIKISLFGAENGMAEGSTFMLRDEVVEYIAQNTSILSQDSAQEH